MPPYHRLHDFPLYQTNPTFRNPAWEQSALRVLVVRLSPYRDVQRSTPHLFLAGEARKGMPDSFIDLAFLPDARDRKLFRENGAPLIVGTQSHRPLTDFDLLLVSNSCIPELVNLAYLLDGCGLPRWASMRAENLPPIVMGGSSSAAAHALVKADGDCMADALFFGEGEGAVDRLVALWAGSAGRPKRERLISAAKEIPGLWPAGDLSRPVRRAVAASGQPATNAPYPILPGPEAQTARLSITLGCPCLCGFCFEGHDRKPFRERPLADLLAEARTLKARAGAETLEIASFNFNTHEDIAALLLELNALFSRVNAMSQRVDILASTPGLLETEIASGKRSFTLGIEGVSDRLRRFLHKSLVTADILAVIEGLHAQKAREIKLFYLLTGHEGVEDFEELGGFLEWLAALRRASRGSPRIIFSFGPLVRMPFTPLRYDRLKLEEEAWRPLAGKARSLCEGQGFEFRSAMPWTDYRLIQVLAAGDYRLHALLEELADRRVLYDDGFPPGAKAVLDAWLARIDADGGLSGEKSGDHRFAFDFLETAGESASLHERFLNAKAGVDGGYCRRGDPGGCAQCPGCTLAGRLKPRAA